MTKDELLNERARKVSQSIIVNSVALFYNDQLRHSKFYKHNLKRHLNQTIKELQKAEVKEYEMMFSSNEKVDDIAADFQELFVDTVQELSKIDLQYIGEINQVIKAYNKSPKSLKGIAKKILN